VVTGGGATVVVTGGGATVVVKAVLLVLGAVKCRII